MIPFHASAILFEYCLFNARSFCEQVDTWNRDKMNIDGSSPFAPGIAPKHSLAPITGPDAIYSGLLECPLTTRIKKIYDNGASGWNDSVWHFLVFCFVVHPFAWCSCSCHRVSPLPLTLRRYLGEVDDFPMANYALLGFKCRLLPRYSIVARAIQSVPQ